MGHRHLNGQDGIQVVAVLDYLLSVNAGGILYSELPVRQLHDMFHHNGHGKTHGIRDGTVAGMALVSASGFTVE